MLVNPDQRLYQVQGFREKPAQQQARSSETSTPKSLPRKPKKGAKHKPSQTPARTEPSEQNSVDGPSVVEATPQPVPEAPVLRAPELQNRLPDALDKAIEETLAVKDLVGLSVGRR